MEPTAATPPAPTPAGKTATGLAVAWLCLGLLGCLGSFPFLFTPEVLANLSMITIPLFASGWGAVFGAMRYRREEYPTPQVAAAVGAGVGLLVGILAITLTYLVLWPPR